MTARNRFSVGFTLVELLVVVLIIGLLTGIVAPRLIGQIGKSEVAAARAQMDAIDKALQSYRYDVGAFPTTAQGLNALMLQSGHTEKWRGPYLKGAVPSDPWGMPYVYLSPGASGREYELLSMGSDRSRGGVGDAKDIEI